MSEASSVTGRSADVSETSSQAEAEAYLRKRHQNAHSTQQQEEDLLEQNKTLQEALFSSMYMLVRAKTKESWRMAVVKVVLEALVPFLVAFNPTLGWPIKTSNPVWQVVRWALPRSPIARIWGYSTYIVILYVIIALIYAVIVAVAALTWAMRKQEHSKWLYRFAVLQQKFTDVMFSVFYVAIFDYLLFLFSCDFGKPGNHHSYWTDIQCLSGSHLINLAVAGFTAIVFFLSTALLLVASCELNPVAPGIMASPAAVTRVRVLLLKAVYVIAAATLGSIPRVQAVFMLVPVAGITWFNFTALPFLRFYINDIWTGGWMGVLYTVTVHLVWRFDSHESDNNVAHEYVDYVLYGILPAIAVGAVITTLWSRYQLMPVHKFLNLEPNTKLAKVHKFRSPADVEVLARVMRHFDSEGLVLEEQGAVGETIIKCGMAVFPNDVGLLILYANFLMEVRRDGPAARTQLQLALKAAPSVIQRYQIFYTIENSKRLKDGQEGALDLQSYVEFKRNYRAVVRVHKAALAAQREFWQLMQRPAVKTRTVEAALVALEAAADAAHQVYRRVLERYPNNGKLLRCYGKFLEDVRNDPLAATRAYAEAARNGGGDGLLSLDLKVQGADKPEFLTSMDLHEDACIVVNAEGKILMVNACVTSLLGYPKVDLEGFNVSVIMPQPFSGRHPSYMSRYVQGGEPHILDTVRDVVALHKDRYMFPLRLCVTKLSGVGTDAIFLGLLRPEPLDTRNVRAWVAPNGVVLCSDPQFASLTGMTSDEMVGRNFQTLVTDNEAVEALLELGRESPFETLVLGTIVRRLEVVHRYLPPIPVEVKVTPGGTDGQRIFILNAHRVDGNVDGLLVVDSRGNITFATWDVAAMLGYPLKKFLKMKLEQLLPAPFSTMHTRHLKDHPAVVPPSSCRAGTVVNLVNINGTSVPVRLKMSSKEDSSGNVKHVVQVFKVDTSSTSAMHADKRLSLLCTMDGKILSVDMPDSTIFGFTASAAVGSNLADCVDIFADWRAKAGAHQLELLLLSLLDKEAEMPGTSWRVKVHSPVTDDTVRIVDAKTGLRQVNGMSACLQSELVDVSELEGGGNGLIGLIGHSVSEAGGVAGGDTAVLTTLARIMLWRRNLLTGVIELDEHLILRKADVSTGLIVGLPPAALPRMPLSKLLDIPKAAKWDELMNRDIHRKSALKSSAATAMVSAPRAFTGSHPDGGSMRIFLQGVSGGPGDRITATLHPDTAFVGARANVYRALGLDSIISHQQNQHDEQHQHQTQQQLQQPSEQHQRPHPMSPELRQPPQDKQIQPVRQASRRIRARSSLGRSGKLTFGGVVDGELIVPGEGQAIDGVSGAAPPDGHLSREVSANVSDGSGSSSSHDDDGGSSDVDGDGANVAGEGGGTRRIPKRKGSGSEDDNSEEHLHRRAQTQSEFIAKWVKSLSRQMSRQVSRQPSREALLAVGPDAQGDVAALEAAVQSAAAAVAPREAAAGALGAAAAGALGAAAAGHDGGGGGGEALAGSRAPSRRGLSLGPNEAVDGTKKYDGGAGAAVVLPSQPAARFFSRRRSVGDNRGGRGSVDANGDGGDDDEGVEDDNDDAEQEIAKRLVKMESNRLAAAANEGLLPVREGSGLSGGKGQGQDGGSSAGDDDDATSGAGGGPTFSDVSSAVDVDMCADARRARLLKRMVKVLSGPYLALPLGRLRTRTLLLLCTMLVTHIACYIALVGLINRQFDDVRAVHRLAMAADRCQVVTTKASLAELCSRPGIAPVSVCEIPLNTTVLDLRTSLDDLEAYHQGTYLGVATTPRRQSNPTLWDMWTNPTAIYQLYMDTGRPQWANITSGVWQLGNRFVAAGRELLYWSPQLLGKVEGLRAYKFIMANGPWALFTGYSVSLDYVAMESLQDISKLQTGLLVLLVVEAAVVQLACILYEWWLVWRVELGRRGEMLVGLGLPGPILRIMASRPLVVVEDSDDDDDDDDDGDGDKGADGAGDGYADVGSSSVARPYGDGVRRSVDLAIPPGGGRRGKGWSAGASGDHDDNGYDAESSGGVGGGVAAPGGSSSSPQGEGPTKYGERAAAVEELVGPGGRSGPGSNSTVIGGKRGAVVRRTSWGGVRVNGKLLMPSPNKLLKFMLPLALWEVALLVVLAVSYTQLERMQEPLVTLNMASRVIYRYTRVRMTALLLVASEETAQRASWRQVLQTEVDNLESEYNTLMYGGVAVTQLGTVFSHPVPASTFASSTFARNFFTEQRCFRWDQSKCYKPDSPYYEVTTHGLDVMMRRIISEMTLLVSDEDADAVYNGTRYTTMYMVGIKDLYEGMQSSAQLFMDYMLGRYDAIKLMHTVLLICTIALFLLYALVVLRPYVSAAEGEAVRLAGLLSHVPAEMDVLTHVRQVLRAHDKLFTAAGRKATAAAKAADKAAQKRVARPLSGLRVSVKGTVVQPASPSKAEMVMGKV